MEKIWFVIWMEGIDMQILFIGNSNNLMVDAHNYLSKYFKVQSVGFEKKMIEQYLHTLSVDLIIVSLKEVEKEQLLLVNSLRKGDWQGFIPILALGFTFQQSIFREIRVADRILTYPFKNELLMEVVCRLCYIKNPVIQLKKNEEDILGDSEMQLKHVLVVDDDSRMLRAVKSWLQETYKVSIVNSGAAAIAFLGKQIPDVILLDYEMPKCNGPQTLELIRKQQKLKDIPVFFLTAVSDRKKVEDVVSLNPQGYILKGITREGMIMKLNEFFASYK